MCMHACGAVFVLGAGGRKVLPSAGSRKPTPATWGSAPALAPAVVKRGRIVEEGTHQQLMERQQAYYTLVQMQQAQASLSDDDDDVEEGEEGLPLSLPLAEHLASVAEVRAVLGTACLQKL